MSFPAAALTETSAQFEQLTRRYASHLAACRENIRRDLADGPSAGHLAAYFERGKMMRPMLVFLCAAAVGGDAFEALPAAEAIELLHVAALIHDDIIDEADERRGLPSLHRGIGASAALVVGDYLILRAFESLTRAVENQSSAQGLKAVRLLSRYAQDCCRGQIQELVPSPDDSTEQHYFSIVQGKTSSQFAAAVTLGAAFGNAGDEELRALRTFGVNAGIAFQIRDDELDVTSDSAVLGKPAGNSMQARRPLLPFIYLAKHGSPDAQAAFAAMRNDPARRHDVAVLLGKEGVLERVRQTQRRFLSRALSALERLRPCGERDALKAIGIYSIHRDH
jgi:geranylgeranyl pyrophosphate synthase